MAVALLRSGPGKDRRFRTIVALRAARSRDLPDKTADIITKFAVPLVPKHAREACSQLISAAGIPRLSDQPSLAEDGVGTYRR